MKHLLFSFFLVFAIALPTVAANYSTEREHSFELQVNGPSGLNMSGLRFSLYSGLVSAFYPQSETMLDAAGHAALDVYGGQHTLQLDIDGMKKVTRSFTVDGPVSLTIDLSENIDAPYGLSCTIDHDIYTAVNTVTLGWNGEETVFEDGFEDYDAFAVNFAPWSGIDGDGVAAADLQGLYPNRGVLNYAQIINPMAVNPVWDPVQYPTLAARTGMQYAGFIQTTSGVPNDDWLITPRLTIGRDNILRFSVKSADKGSARFVVGITEVAEPRASDFIVISDGNYIEADYRGWTDVEISLADYVGRDVKIGFHCISATGAFISQLDDVFVGRLAEAGAIGCNTRRVAPHKAGGPYESYIIRLDGVEVARTRGLSYVLDDVAPGEHVAEIVCTGLEAVSEAAVIPFTIDPEDFVRAEFALSTNNGEVLSAVNLSLGSCDRAYTVPLVNGAATVPSLPKGRYSVAVAEEFYHPYNSDIRVEADGRFEILLEEVITAPFNVAHSSEEGADGLADVTVTWNRNYGFYDSFEEYDDFATDYFGGWTTRDRNTMEQYSYPIGLGSMYNIVTFPGCSTTSAPACVPPLVFNPLTTLPSMASDPAVAAPTGEKTILFQGPQGARADKWLISPEISVREGYEFSVVAKAYAIYTETLEFCISTNGTYPSRFTVLDAVNPPHSEWTKYVISLADYVGKEVRVAVHCTSNDGFLVQVDDISVGREGGEEAAAAGYVRYYNVSLDGGEPVVTGDKEITFDGLADGRHTVSITAVYSSGISDAVIYEFEIGSAGAAVSACSPELSVVAAGGNLEFRGKGTAEVFTPRGERVATADVDGALSLPLSSGIYIVRTDSGRVLKFRR